MEAKEHLEAVFRADRALRDAELKLLAVRDRDQLVAVLVEAVKGARKLSDRPEATLRLKRLSDLLAQVQAPETIDALVDVLDDDDDQVRVTAAEALVDVGFDRFADLAKSVERALAKRRPGPALCELPWVLAEIGEPGAVSLLARFLLLDDADAVAAAIESLVEIGDPRAVKDLEKLKNDRREVDLDEGDALSATIGDLAEDAINELSAPREGD